MFSATLFSVALLALALAGCGESNRSKSVRASSQVNVLAEKFAADVGADGWFKRHTTDEVDPWGRKIEVKYHRANGHEMLAVWSDGPDGLPHTRDDISSHRYWCDNELVLAEIAALKSKGRLAAVENYGAALTRGLTKGSVQGWQERNPKTPENNEKKVPK
jgi:hypothetical protein